MPKDGEVRKRRRGRSGTKYEIYRDPPGEWRTTTGDDYRRARDTWLEQQGGTTAYTALSAPSGSPTSSIRYPRDAAMASGSDYVLFEFYKYVPPFQNINKGAAKNKGTALSVYNQSASDESLYEKVDGLDPIVMYMPEDVSTGFKANWSGKSFSNIATSALATAGSGDFGQTMQNSLNTIGTTFAQAIPNAGNKVIRDTISKITGESLSQNDVFGATRGVILNPNVELLFGGIDLRNFQLRYKMVPRNAPESSNIKQIVKIFKKAMLPSFADGDELNFSGKINTSNSFIKVPNVCRVSFMRGGGPNPDVAQYKMCAITQVDINYTPDGTYATYEDGSMVATELTLSFQETKLIFAEEVENY